MKIKNKIQKFTNVLNLIKSPLITEKTVKLFKKNQYIFLVDRLLSKSQLKIALKNIFEKKILHINTCILPKKKKRIEKKLGFSSNYKKIFITFEKNSLNNNFFQF
jgi:large subunit ribosomal protein L23